MKIAFVTSIRYHKHTGARTRATRIQKLLSESHEVVQFNVNTFNRGTMPAELRGVDLKNGRDTYPHTIREFLAGIDAYRNIDGEFDVVWSYLDWQHAPLIAWICARKIDAPLVVGVNDRREFAGLKGRVLNDWLRSAAIGNADAIVLESDTLVDEVQRIGVAENVPRFVIPTGIDVNAFYHPETDLADRPTVFYVGRDNDLDLLFASEEIVTRTVPNVEFRIAGVDPEVFPRIAARENVTFLGYIDESDLHEEMARSHVCTVPYRTETAGRPVKLLEYMSAGKCIVATDFPFNTQMIDHDRNGLIADPTPQAYADALLRALTDDDVRDRLATTAREDVQAYSLENMHTSLNEVVRTVVETDDNN